jgi:acetolactate synthase-1/2/3 large subunit
MATCGEVLVQLLEDRDVEVVFGIPGVHTVELYRGLPMTNIRHVTPRHEQGAGFIADGYARVSGKPGVCFIITGPGMTNITTAMGQAYADSVPMLVISSVNRSEHLRLGEGRLHELPSQRDLVSGVAAFSHTVLSPEQLPGIIDQAFTVFAAGRPRPVHIELPLDVITASGEAMSRRRPDLPGRPGPRPEQIAKAAGLLAHSERPLLVLGGGAADAGEAAVQMADHFGALIVNTINAKGIVARDHPALIGGNMAAPPIAEVMGKADVVLAVGTEFGETEMYPGPVDLEIGGTLIRIDIDPGQLVRGCLPDVAILSDARLALEALWQSLQDTPSHGSEAAQWTSRAPHIREALRGTWPDGYHVHERVLGVVNEALPNAIWVGDQAQPVYGANQFLQPAAPNQEIHGGTADHDHRGRHLHPRPSQDRRGVRLRRRAGHRPRPPGGPARRYGRPAGADGGGDHRGGGRDLALRAGDHRSASQ